jgi:hypothetical protein
VTPHHALANALEQHLENRHDTAIRTTNHPRAVAQPVWVAVINPPLHTPAQRRLAAAHLRKDA